VTGSETTDIEDVAPTRNDADAVVTIIDDGASKARRFLAPALPLIREGMLSGEGGV